MVTQDGIFLKETTHASELSLVIQLVAASVGTSYLLIFLPNVETITLAIFFYGYSFTARFSFKALVATLAVWEIVANLSWGFSVIAFPFKFLGWLLIYILGMASHRFSLDKPLEFAAIGAVGTLVWDLVATLSTAVVLSTSVNEFLAVYFTSLILGIPFTIVHVTSNTYLFFMFPYLLKSVVPHLKGKYPQYLR
ncbi:MAG: hypothetical protein D6732_09690 [Methanobacteriota archaeon]|nr:MAG: hypothetical protein D6732_09690 [Euryarchaeota archaeon]